MLLRVRSSPLPCLATAAPAGEGGEGRGGGGCHGGGRPGGKGGGRPLQRGAPSPNLQPARWLLNLQQSLASQSPFPCPHSPARMPALRNTQRVPCARPGQASAEQPRPGASASIRPDRFRISPISTDAYFYAAGVCRAAAGGGGGRAGCHGAHPARGADRQAHPAPAG